MIASPPVAAETAAAATRSRPRDGSLVKTIAVARYRRRRNRFRVAVRRHPARTALQTFIFIPVFFTIALVLMIAIGGGLAKAGSDRDATAILGALLTLMAIAAFIGSSTTALQSLYFSRDLSLLMTLPMPLRVIFGEKLVEAMTGALPAAYFGAIALLAYGVTRASSLLYIPAAILAGLAVLTISTALSVIVVALITRAIPARRARLFLFAVSIATVGLTLALWNQVAPTRSSQGGFPGPVSLAGLDGALTWLPTGWIAIALSAAGGASHSPWSPYAPLAAVTLVLAVIGSYQVFARSYARSLAATRSLAPAKTTPNSNASGAWLHRVLPGNISALVAKEWTTLARDPRRLSGIIWPLGVVMVYALSSRRQEPAPDLVAYRFWLTNGSLMLVPWALSLGVSIYAFGGERGAIHVLRLLPIGPRRLFFAKSLAMLLPILAVSETIGLIAAAAGGGSLAELVALAALIGWAACGFVVIDVAASAWAPNFDADHVQRSTELIGRGFSLAAGGLFGMMTGLAVARLVLYARGLPASLASSARWSIGGVEPFGWPLIVAALLIAVAIIVVVSRIAIRGVDDLIRNGP